MLYIAFLSLCVPLECRGMVSPCHGTRSHPGLHDFKKNKKNYNIVDNRPSTSDNGQNLFINSMTFLFLKYKILVRYRIAYMKQNI